MRPSTPSDLVDSLEPPAHAVLKREERTVVWRERRRDGGWAVAKLYRRRGLIAEFRSRVFRFRVEREFRRLAHLVQWKVPATVPRAWGRGWSPEHGFHELLVMDEIPDARQLDQLLREPGNEAELAPLFRIVRRMHESGLCHQTLYAANVLVTPRVSGTPGVDFVLADIPRSWVFPRSLVGSSMALWDLLDLEYTIVQAGGELSRGQLDAYGRDGLGRDGEAWLAERRGSDSTTKGLRLRRDLVARLRWALAWSAVWKAKDRP